MNASDDTDTYLSLWRGAIPLPDRKIRLTQSVYDDAVAIAAAQYHCRPQQIDGESRIRRIAHARQFAMYLLRSKKNAAGGPLYSYPEIGRMFGKDHTTAIHAYREVKKRLLEAEQEAA
jgi:chromosomal replication initiation ATPase DnaA